MDVCVDVLLYSPDDVSVNVQIHAPEESTKDADNNHECNENKSYITNDHGHISV